MSTAAEVCTAAPVIARFRKLADSLENKIEYAGRPMTQNPTPKRNREYQSRMHDCRNLERTQKALRALADAHESGTVPDSLSHLKTRAEVEEMVCKYTDVSKGGYYSCIECDDYHDTSAAARILQGMIDGNPEQSAERERVRKIDELEAEVKLSKIPGYFPTPAPVISLMLKRARVTDGMKILEPSAGSGNIADAIRAAYPRAWVDTIEKASSLRNILALKNYRVMAFDFMEFTNDQESQYDRVVMNPPFERQQDIDHVRKAYELLKPGGLLVSVMAPGFEFRKDRKSTEFREWLADVGGTSEDLPEGSFKSSGTGVNARLVVIEKESQPKEEPKIETEVETQVIFEPEAQNSFDLGEPRQNGLEFPQSLTERYSPRKIADFVGLDRPKAMLTALADNPHPCSFLFVGPPGAGKTALGLAFAEQLPGSLHHISAQKCDVATLDELNTRFAYMPPVGKFWVCLVDEADNMTEKAQLQLLSRLDGTAALKPVFGGGYVRGEQPPVIWIFTCNGRGEDGCKPPTSLASRFLSRNMIVPFPAVRPAELTSYLESIWLKENGPETSAEYFSYMADGVGVRDALMRLESDLLAGPRPVPTGYGAADPEAELRARLLAAGVRPERAEELLAAAGTGAVLSSAPAALDALRGGVAPARTRCRAAATRKGSANAWDDPEIRARRLEGMRRAAAERKAARL